MTGIVTARSPARRLENSRQAKKKSLLRSENSWKSDRLELFYQFLEEFLGGFGKPAIHEFFDLGIVLILIT